jgi:preprotein translocase subunit SecG
MNTFYTFIVIVQVLSALVIIGLVLLQHGKGADMGAAFGSGASGSLFGATGSSNFLSKSTGIAAAIFFAATLALSFASNRRTTAGAGVMENLPAAPVKAGPSTPATSAPAVSASATVSASSTASGMPADQSSKIPK